MPPPAHRRATGPPGARPGGGEAAGDLPGDGPGRGVDGRGDDGRSGPAEDDDERLLAERPPHHDRGV